MMWNSSTRYQRSWWPIWCVLISGLCCSAAFAPFKLWPLAFLGLAGLLLAVQHQSAKRTFRLTWLFAMALNIPTLWWIHFSMTQFGGIPLVGAMGLILILCSYLSLYPAIAIALLNRFFPKVGPVRLLLAFPALWLLSDTAIHYFLTGFPWVQFGYTQIDTWLTGYAPLLGSQGITLIVLLSTASLMLSLQRRQILWLLIPPVLFVAGYGLQQQRWTTPGKTVQFALVQGNIPQSLKWDPNSIKPTLVRYLDLTRQNKDVDVVVWPESAIPTLENDLPKFLTDIDQTLREDKVGFITGIQYYDKGKNAYYNAVLGMGLQDSAGQQRYTFGQGNRWYKHHLVPIGEFVPFEAWLRPIAPFFDLPMSSFSRGDIVQPNLLVKGYQFAVSICYEMEFSDELRQNIHPDTQFIVNVSNDSWFGTSNGPLQHMEIARMRAIEFGKPVVRATNSGVTMAVDGQGNVISQMPQFITSVLKVGVAPTTGVTPYTYVGDLPLYGFIIAALLISFGLLVRGRNENEIRSE